MSNKTAISSGAPTPSPILELQELQFQRTASIRSQLRIDNQSGSMTRRALGWRWDAPEKERAALCKVAAKIVTAIQKGKPVAEGHTAVADAVRPFVMASSLARREFTVYREKLEARMEELAKSLPVWAWAKTVRGLGAMSLAKIVGEAGDIGTYANPGKLWKRMGVAPPDSYTMTCKDGRSARAIPKRRRSELWVIGDCLIKQNRGEFRRAYDERKAQEKQNHPELTKLHCHRRAQRFMEKRLLLELWKAWHADNNPA